MKSFVCRQTTRALQSTVGWREQPFSELDAERKWVLTQKRQQPREQPAPPVDPVAQWPRCCILPGPRYHLAIQQVVHLTSFGALPGAQGFPWSDFGCQVKRKLSSRIGIGDRSSFREDSRKRRMPPSRSWRMSFVHIHRRGSAARFRVFNRSGRWLGQFKGAGWLKVREAILCFCCDPFWRVPSATLRSDLARLRGRQIQSTAGCGTPSMPANMS